MYVRTKQNRSGTISVLIVDKSSGVYKEVHSVGVAKSADEVSQLIAKGKEWILENVHKNQLKLDLYGEESALKRQEIEQIERFLSHIDNILLNGCELILNRVFDSIGFDKIDDEIFRKLVISRLSYPSSKAATVEYLKNHFDEDVSLSKIYRYLDRLNSSCQEQVQSISVEHTQRLFEGNIGIMFYDVTTVYFETDKPDELRKTGFSKEGRHQNPQIILGLLVSQGGYPLAYCIHEGNKYEGHTMLPVVKDFIKRYHLTDFVVVADSGLMNNDNITQLEAAGYKYILGSRIKNESSELTAQILSLEKADNAIYELDKGGRRLLIGYSDSRARKDRHNREKGVERLEKMYKSGKLSKENINRRGYNKFLKMEGNTTVEINREMIEKDAVWDGLKGYLTNTALPKQDVLDAYHNLWNVECAFRIAKSKIEVRPMFHFTKKRIEAHICICFVALKVYKELERLLKHNAVPLSVDKVIKLAKTVTTISIYLPKNKEHIQKTMLLKRHKPIEMLFDEKFWVAQ